VTTIRKERGEPEIELPRALWRKSTFIRICPVTVTKPRLWPSQKVIGFAGHRVAGLLRTMLPITVG